MRSNGIPDAGVHGSGPSRDVAAATPKSGHRDCLMALYPKV
jgi:hypothetical protein